MRTTFRLGVVMLLFAFSMNAQAGEIGLWIATSQVGETLVDESEISFDNGEGFGISFNHFWTPNLSTEFAATPLKHDGTIEVGEFPTFDLGSLDIIPVTATAQWHFARGGRFSPYVGAGISYVMADDIESDDLRSIGVDKVEVDSKVGWLAQAGIDIGLSERFAVAVDAKYIPYSPESTDPADPEPVKLDLDPLVISAGVKFRW